jgi:TrmH family RNA methyltransferase
MVEVQPGVLTRVLDTVTPQPIAATAARVDVPLADVVHAQLVLVLAGVSDPGNAGTLIRTAAAAGADLVMISRHSVDVYNPKTVRATAGALFHLPLVVEVDLQEALNQLGRAGVKRWGTQTRGGCDFTEANLAAPSAILLGNEAHGIPELPAAGLDGQLTIPMSGAVESLNVAVAGSVLLFEAARQRNFAGKHGKRRGAA